MSRSGLFLKTAPLRNKARIRQVDTIQVPWRALGFLGVNVSWNPGRRFDRQCSLKGRNPVWVGAESRQAGDRSSTAGLHPSSITPISLSPGGTMVDVITIRSGVHRAGRWRLGPTLIRVFICLVLLALCLSPVRPAWSGTPLHQPAASGHGGGMTHGQTEQAGQAAHPPAAGQAMAHTGHAMADPVWADPNIALSPPPPLMGRQMGRVRTLNVPPLGYELDGRVKVFTLIAQPVERELTSGKPPDESLVEPYNRFTGGMQHATRPKKARLWGFNGQVPGPTIEVVRGDRVRLILINELPEPTSIHWHGLEVPNDMDGAGGHTEPVTPPGGRRVYEFTVDQVGTYMYHTGFNVMKQDGLGLGGIFVIHPRKEKRRIDRDVAIMLQSYALLPGNPNPNLVTMDFNWFTFNSKVAPDIETIRVKQGDRIRLRFANLSMTSHPIHVHGHVWKVVGTEGGPISESAQWPGSTINVPPGTTRDVEFTAWNPGLWRLHCHKLHHIVNAHADIPMGVMDHGGMFTFLWVEPKKGGDK